MTFAQLRRMCGCAEPLKPVHGVDDIEFFVARMDSLSGARRIRTVLLEASDPVHSQIFTFLLQTHRCFLIRIFRMPLNLLRIQLHLILPLLT